MWQKAGCACADNPKAPPRSLSQPVTQAVGGKTRFPTQEQAAAAQRQIAAWCEFREHAGACWEACEPWADAQLEPTPATPSAGYVRLSYNQRVNPAGFE